MIRSGGLERSTSPADAVKSCVPVLARLLGSALARRRTTGHRHRISDPAAKFVGVFENRQRDFVVLRRSPVDSGRG